MASLYPKPRSPFWYMEWRDSRTGKLLNRSTRYRRESVEQTRKARQLCAQRTAEELDAPRAGADNWRWVEPWLTLSYAGKTLTRYREAWAAFSAFMLERKISAPRQLERETAAEYLAWRMKPPNESGVRKASKNTALLDLKVMSRLMREAVLRRLAAANPFLQLGFKSDPVKSRPDILPNELEIIERALPECGDEVLQISWGIAMLYGRRLTETCVPLSAIDLKRETITFRNKGGEPRTKLLHPRLVPLVKKWRLEGRTHTFVMPSNFSKRWCQFFDRIGLPHLTFHSVRVRAATRLMEAGVDRRIAMDYLDHSSTLVHAIYVRARPSHHQPAIDALDSKTWSGTEG